MSEPEDETPKSAPPATEEMSPKVERSPSVPATHAARSGRWPWLRSVAYSLMVFLSPAVWVIDTSSCAAEGAEPVMTSSTGIELARGMDVSGGPETLAWALVLALVLAAPFLAWRARTPLARLGFHVLGLLGALFGMMCAGMLVFFTLFNVREVQPAGYLVLLLSTLPLIESFARIALGITEARAHHAQPPRAGP